VARRNLGRNSHTYSAILNAVQQAQCVLRTGSSAQGAQPQLEIWNWNSRSEYARNEPAGTGPI
jgi:hypothetical protein